METNILATIIAIAAALVAYILVIRPWYLWWGATDAEIEHPMPGDDEIENPTHVTTRAVTIRARASEIWPWLAQMGYKRGGLYSYDGIDRLLGVLDGPSADRILPEYQKLEAGDAIPMGSGPSWPVKAIEPNKSLLVVIEEPGMKYTWSWGLHEAEEGHTRLVLRIRTQLTRRRLILALHIFDFIAFAMTRKHLLGIKERAEAGSDGYEN